MSSELDVMGFWANAEVESASLWNHRFIYLINNANINITT